MAADAQGHKLQLLILIQDSLEIASPMQDLNNQDCVLLREISVENHVLWKAGNQYPPQPDKRWGTKTTKGSAFGQGQQGAYRLIHGRIPLLYEIEV